MAPMTSKTEHKPTQLLGSDVLPDSLHAPDRLIHCGEHYVVAIKTDQAQLDAVTSLMVVHGRIAVGKAVAVSRPSTSCQFGRFGVVEVEVQAAYRRQGVGRMMLRLLEREVVAMHRHSCDDACPCVELGVWCEASCHGFFEDSGFSFEGLDGLQAIKMLPASDCCSCGACLNGWLSPRMREALVHTADLHGEAVLDLIQEADEAAGSSCAWPLADAPLNAALADTPALRSFLMQFNRKTLTKLFLTGCSECLFTTCELLASGRAPTHMNVLVNWQSNGPSAAARNCFLDNGGSITAVLQHTLTTSQQQWEVAGRTYPFWMDADGLPSCANDALWSLVALHLLGPDCNENKLHAAGPR